MENFGFDDTPLSTALSAEAIEKLAELSGVSLVNLHIPTGDVLLNHVTTRLIGCEPGDLPHSKDTKMMATFEDDRERVAKAFELLLTGEADHYQLEYRMRRQDGSIVSVLETAIVYERDEHGTPVRIASMALDLSRLRWAEEKARTMEREAKRLSQAQTQSDLAEQNRMLRAANAAAANIIGGFHQDYETVLTHSLQLLAESIQADRVMIWRNVQRDEGLCCYLRAQWVRDPALISGETGFTCYDAVYTDWSEIFREHSSIQIGRAHV